MRGRARSNDSRQNLNRGKFGDVVQLGYQVGGALSTCRLPFRSMILDRYPEQDSAMFPFPGEQLPMFVYPKVRCVFASNAQYQSRLAHVDSI